MRLAEPFEKIRERTARTCERTGRYPKVLLLKRGDVKMRMARANFCLNFFGCAGFDIAGASSTSCAADLIVLCSSDPEYPALAPEVCPTVAGPGDRGRQSQGADEQLEGRRGAGFRSRHQRRRRDADRVAGPPGDEGVSQ